MSAIIAVNRAPVLTLWAAVVAERLGFARDEALTLGRAVAGMNAQTKAVRLGLRASRSPAGKSAGERRARASAGGAAPMAVGERVELLGREVPVVHTPLGIRAAKDGRPDAPEAVVRYLEAKFGEALEPTRVALEALARSLPPRQLATQAFALYEAFRPEIPTGTRGWGAKGVLDLARIRRLAGTAGRSG